MVKAPATKPKAPATKPKAPAPRGAANVPAVKKQQASSDLPMVPDEFSTAIAGMGTGLENVTAADILIPRLTILQGLSPQVTRGQPEYDPDAKVGEIYDTGVKERFPNGIVFLPVYFEEQWLEWADRKTGKGLQRIHQTDAIMSETERDEKTSRDMLSNGNYVVATYQLYGMNVSADFRKSFIPFSSTQRKKCKQLLTWANGEKVQRDDGTAFTPPLFFRTYAFETVPESNNQGNWMGWKIERGAPITDFGDWRQLLLEVKSFREALAKGDVRGDIESMAREANDGRTVDHDPNGRM